MNQPTEPLEILWDNLLSRDPERVQAAFATLDEAGRANILAHLRRMVSEPDWHPEQRASALAALATLEAQKPAPRKNRRHK